MLSQQFYITIISRKKKTASSVPNLLKEPYYSEKLGKEPIYPHWNYYSPEKEISLEALRTFRFD